MTRKLSNYLKMTRKLSNYLEMNRILSRRLRLGSPPWLNPLAPVVEAPMKRPMSLVGYRGGFGLGRCFRTHRSRRDAYACAPCLGCLGRGFEVFLLLSTTPKR